MILSLATTRLSCTFHFVSLQLGLSLSHTSTLAQHVSLSRSLFNSLSLSLPHPRIRSEFCCDFKIKFRSIQFYLSWLGDTSRLLIGSRCVVYEWMLFGEGVNEIFACGFLWIRHVWQFKNLFRFFVIFCNENLTVVCELFVVWMFNRVKWPSSELIGPFVLVDLNLQD